MEDVKNFRDTYGVQQFFNDEKLSVKVFLKTNDKELKLTVMEYLVEDDDEVDIYQGDIHLTTIYHINYLSEETIYIIYKKESNYQFAKHLLIYKIDQFHDDGYYLRVEMDKWCSSTL